MDDEGDEGDRDDDEDDEDDEDDVAIDEVVSCVFIGQTTRATA
jgi:hypothetical protein